MLITVDFVMSHNPCRGYTRECVASLLGPGKTLLECLRSDAVPAQDRIWLATRFGACSMRVQRLFACWCADQVLPRFEAAYPDDDRPRIAIQVATAHAMGEATRDELAAARDAARDSARDSARAAWDAIRASAMVRASARDAAWAAMDAAYDAACAASAWSAARAAARDAAWAATSSAYSAQVAALIELLETHGE